MALQQKILDAFIGKVVRKDLAFLVKGGLPVPTYVLEYLLGQYCATDDPEAIEAGLEKVKLVIKNNCTPRRGGVGQRQDQGEREVPHHRQGDGDAQ